MTQLIKIVNKVINKLFQTIKLIDKKIKSIQIINKINIVYNKCEMAFVYQSQRRINQVSKLTNPTAPGQYFQSPTNISVQGCAPFGSTGIRKSLFDEKPQVKVSPGDYDISQNIIEPNIKTVSNTHSIIVKINSTGTSQFKSDRQRFGRDQTDVPGPGAYRLKGIAAEFQSPPKSSPASSLNKKVKLLTQSLKKYPTIPNKVRGLTDMKNEQQIPTQQKVGPALYNPTKKVHLNLTSAVWGKDKTRRFSLDKASQVGPGKYTPSNAQQKGQHPSFHFKSATVRTYFQTLYYNTNLNQTARDRTKSCFKLKQPSPFSYQTNKSSLKITEKPFSFQFFGSTVERFPQEELNVKKKSATFYNLRSSIGKNTSFNKGNSSFNAQANRTNQFLQIQQKIKLPGPGYYQQQVKVHKKLRGVKVQKFGSTTHRPINGKDQESDIGPGAYFTPRQQEDQIIKNKFGQLKQTTSNFRSTTSRNCFGVVKNQIPLGQYNVNQHDIATKLQRQNNYLSNLKKIQVLPAPFQSTHSRFPHYQSQPQNKKPTVDQINKEHQIKVKQESQKVREAIIGFNKTQLKEQEARGFGKAIRWQEDRKGAPGIGKYKIDTSFERKTHNIKFTKPSN